MNLPIKPIARRCIAVLGALLCAQVLAHAPLVNEASLAPTADQRTATQLITHFISNYHYKKIALDDALSAEILDRYLESLDPNRSYFIQSDIDRYSVHRDHMDDYLRSAQLEIVFDIFKEYRRRVSARVAYAKTLLDRDFDFTRDEYYEFDRSELPWAADVAELDEIWRQRVKNDVLSLRLAEKSPDQIRKTLTERYDGIERRTMQINSDDVFQLFVNAYTTSIEPHTAYFSPRTSENFRIRMSLSLEGIGAVLQNDEVFTVVRQIVPGGPADKSNALHANDRIVGVAQGHEGDIVDVVGWRLDDVVDLIRGPKDTVVRLEILPKGTGPEGPSKVIQLTRNKIELEEQAAHKSILEIPAEHPSVRIGVITIPTFYLDFEARARGDKNYRSTTRDVRHLLTELKNESVDGILIDLRGNGGGSLTEATELTGLFIKSGPIVQVRGSDGRIQIESDTDPSVEYGGPLAILVDRNSASASEIFAGAIQDYRRGVIIGEPTFGKGTVQNLVDLDRLDRRSHDSELGQLKTTIAQFFRIGGASTQHRGVIPDIVFPTADTAQNEGERALENALPWAQVKPAKFVPATAHIASVANARRLHEMRIAHDDGFKVLLEEAQLIEEAKEKKRVSLVEADRRAEMERAKHDNTERENRMRRLQGLPPLAPGEEVADQDEEPGDEDGEEAYDVVLHEAANILNDLLPRRKTLKAQRESGAFAADFADAP